MRRRKTGECWSGAPRLFHWWRRMHVDVESELSYRAAGGPPEAINPLHITSFSAISSPRAHA